MFESIAIVGDIHIREEAPRSRTDNYFDTCMNKIDKLMAKHKYVIILGDFFDKSNIPVEYLNEAIDRLSKYTGRIYTVLGNHDAHYRTLKLNKTSIGLLDKVGVVQLKLDSFSIEGISFDVASVVPELKLPEKKSNILLGHFYLEKSGQAKESMHTEDLLEYEYVFLGHEHEPQEPLQIGNTTIFRNGSLLRKDADSYNLERSSIFYAELSYSGEVSIQQLEVMSPETVFTPESFTRPRPKIICDFSNLELLMQNFQNSNTRNNMSTHRVLVDIEAPDVCIEYLRGIHEHMGLVF